jgi:ketosteroid isomerase-like protein
MKQSRVMLVISIVAHISLAISLKANDTIEVKVKDIFKHYNAFDTALIEFTASKFNIKDYTTGIKITTPEQLKKSLKNSKNMIENWSSVIEDIFYVSKYVASVRGVNSGKVNGKPFKTRFVTVLVFNKQYQVVSWSDHIDPKTFAGGSITSDRHKSTIASLFKLYGSYKNSDSTLLGNYLSPDIVFVDPTFRISTKGIDTLKHHIWPAAVNVYEKADFRINDYYFITEDVVNITGTLYITTKKGKNIASRFSTVLIFEKDRIKNWVDHFDKLAFE